MPLSRRKATLTMKNHAGKMISVTAVCILAVASLTYIINRSRVRAAMSTTIIIFPDHFRGLAKVCDAASYDPTGTNISSRQIVFDGNGQVIHGHRAMLSEFSRVQVRLSDGTSLPIWDSQYSRPLSKDELGVWMGGSVGSSNCIYLFVGTAINEDEFARSAMKGILGDH